MPKTLGESRNDVNQSIQSSSHSIENKIRIKLVASSVDSTGAQQLRVERDRNMGQ
ncbi:hypothetical protein J1N35_037524, partial [Gossypium stocksii]